MHQISYINKKGKSIKVPHSIKTYDESYNHFNLRLKERYNLEISLEEYNTLNRKISNQHIESLNDYIFLYSISKYRKLIYLKIKESWVLCIYGKNKFDITNPKSLLKTCIKLEHGFPVPKELKIIGWTSTKFENEVNKYLKQAYDLIPVYLELGSKKFFMEHPANLPLKGLVKTINNDFNSLSMIKIINHLILQNESKL